MGGGLILGILSVLLLASHAAAQPASGPLRVSPQHLRDFADPGGKIAYLTGSRTWSSPWDMGETDPPPARSWPYSMTRFCSKKPMV